MLTVTDSAIEQLRGLRSQPGVPGDVGVRIARRETDGEFAMSLTGTAAAGDQVIEADDVLLFLAAEAVIVLNDKVLDASVGDQGQVSFVIDEQKP
jgi:Fe-S cluster assembly iron-binding protein IscA